MKKKKILKQTKKVAKKATKPQKCNEKNVAKVEKRKIVDSGDCVIIQSGKDKIVIRY